MSSATGKVILVEDVHAGVCRAYGIFSTPGSVSPALAAVVQEGHHLDWSAYADMAVANDAITSGTSQMRATSEPGQPTTVTALQDMSIVEILARILDLQDMTSAPTTFALSSPPTVDWDDPNIAFAPEGLDDTGLVLVFKITMPNITFDGGGWSDNNNPARSSTLRLWKQSPDRTSFVPLHFDDSAPAAVMPEGGATFPLAHGQVHNLRFLQQDIRNLVDGGDADVVSGSVEGSSAAEVLLNSDGTNLKLVLKGVASSTLAVRSVLYYNQDEPSPAIGEVPFVVEDTVQRSFRRRIKWPGTASDTGWQADSQVVQYIPVGGSLSGEVHVGTLADMRITLVHGHLVPATFEPSVVIEDFDVTSSNVDLAFSALPTDLEHNELQSVVFADLGDASVTGALSLVVDHLAVRGGGQDGLVLRRLHSISGQEVPLDSELVDGIPYSGRRRYRNLRAFVTEQIEVRSVELSNTIDGTTHSVIIRIVRSFPEVVLRYVAADQEGIAADIVSLGGSLWGVREQSMLLRSPVLIDHATQLTETLAAVSGEGTWTRSFTLAYDSVGSSFSFSPVETGSFRQRGNTFYVDRRRLLVVLSPSSDDSSIQSYPLSAGMIPFAGTLQYSVNVRALVDDGTPAPFVVASTRVAYLTRTRTAPVTTMISAGVAAFETGEWNTGTLKTSGGEGVDEEAEVLDLNNINRRDNIMDMPTPDFVDEVPPIVASDCMRFGLLFIMTDGTSETYSFPMDEIIRRWHSGDHDFKPFRNLVRMSTEEAAVLESSSDPFSYDIASAARLSQADVQDTGDGLLHGVDGFVVRASWMWAFHLVFSRVGDGVLERINGTLISNLPTGHVWEVMDGSSLSIKFDINVTCTFVHGDDATIHTLEIAASNELLVMLTEQGSNYHFSLRTQGTDSDTLVETMGRANDAIINISSADPESTYSMQVRCIKSELGGFRANNGAVTNRILAVGARIAARERFRDVRPPDGDVLLIANDIDEVNRVYEYLEWPAEGTDFFGFGIGDTNDRRWPKVMRKWFKGELSILHDRATTKARVDGYNRYYFRGLTVAANGHTGVPDDSGAVYKLPLLRFVKGMTGDVVHSGVQEIVLPAWEHIDFV